MSKKLSKQRLISVVLLIELTIFRVSCGDHQSKVTSTTVQTSPNHKPGLLSVYPQSAYPPNDPFALDNRANPNAFSQPARRTNSPSNTQIEPQSDVTYSEPTLEERTKSKINLIKKEKYLNDALHKDQQQQQLNLYKRPSQFSDLIKNPQLLNKQRIGMSLSNGRLTSDQLNKLTSEQSDQTMKFELDDERLKSTGDTNSKYELNNQFAQSLNYLIKYMNRQGQTKLINGTERTKDVNNILLKHARNLDRDNCLLRLICEISSNEADASDSQLIKEIRIVFG